MFKYACSKIRDSIYALVASSPNAPGKYDEENLISLGTAIMVAPGILLTASHLIHIQSSRANPIHQSFEVVRPDATRKVENAVFLTEDSDRDMALLKIEEPSSKACVYLEPNQVPIGASCGLMGFPLPTEDDGNLYFVKRFQSGHLSAYTPLTLPSGARHKFYELDFLAYIGFTGSPVFLTNGNVLGMYVRSAKSTGMITNITNPVESRHTISLCIPSMEIISFLREKEIID